ncbi:MAG: hypothetical protein AAGD35_02600 [Actinomycetota bacterium]
MGVALVLLSLAACGGSAAGSVDASDVDGRIWALDRSVGKRQMILLEDGFWVQISEEDNDPDSGPLLFTGGVTEFSDGELTLHYGNTGTWERLTDFELIREGVIVAATVKFDGASVSSPLRATFVECESDTDCIFIPDHLAREYQYPGFIYDVLNEVPEVLDEE